MKLLTFLVNLNLKFRIIRAAFVGREWRIILEGLPEKVYAIDFFTDDRPSGLECVNLSGAPDGAVRVLLRPPPDANRMPSGFARWNTVISWKRSK